MDFERDIEEMVTPDDPLKEAEYLANHETDLLKAELDATTARKKEREDCVGQIKILRKELARYKNTGPRVLPEEHVKARKLLEAKIALQQQRLADIDIEEQGATRRLTGTKPKPKPDLFKNGKRRLKITPQVLAQR